MKYSLQKRISAFVLAFALVMTTAFNSIGATTKADAAAAKVKTLYLTKKVTSATVGDSFTAQWAVKATKASKAMAKVTVKSDDPSVVKVTKITQSKKAGTSAKKAKKTKGTATLEAVGAGEAKITITTVKKTKKKKKLSKSFTVKVAAKETPASSETPVTPSGDASKDPVAPSVESLNVTASNGTTIGETEQTTLSVSSGTQGGVIINDTITFESKNPAILSVDAKGVVTGLKAGQANVLVSAKDSTGKTITAEVAITVTELADATITVPDAQKSLTILVGKSVKLTPSVNPATYADKLIYESSKPDLVEVSADGTITAKAAADEVTITIKAKGTKGNASVKVKSVANGYGIASFEAIHADTLGVKLTTPVSVDDFAKLTFGVKLTSSIDVTASMDATGLISLKSAAGELSEGKYTLTLGSTSLVLDDTNKVKDTTVAKRAPKKILITNKNVYAPSDAIKIEYKVVDQYNDAYDTYDAEKLSWTLRYQKGAAINTSNAINTTGPDCTTKTGGIVNNGFINLSIHGQGGADTDLSAFFLSTPDGQADFDVTAYVKDMPTVNGSSSFGVKKLAIKSVKIVGLASAEAGVGSKELLYKSAQAQNMFLKLDGVDENNNPVDWAAYAAAGYSTNIIVNNTNTTLCTLGAAGASGIIPVTILANQSGKTTFSAIANKDSVDTWELEVKDNPQASYIVWPSTINCAIGGSVDVKVSYLDQEKKAIKTPDNAPAAVFNTVGLTGVSYTTGPAADDAVTVKFKNAETVTITIGKDAQGSQMNISSSIGNYMSDLATVTVTSLAAPTTMGTDAKDSYSILVGEDATINFWAVDQYKSLWKGTGVSCAIDYDDNTVGADTAQFTSVLKDGVAADLADVARVDDNASDTMTIDAAKDATGSIIVLKGHSKGTTKFKYTMYKDGTTPTVIGTKTISITVVDTPTKFSASVKNADKTVTAGDKANIELTAYNGTAKCNFSGKATVTFYEDKNAANADENAAAIVKGIFSTQEIEFKDGVATFAMPTKVATAASKFSAYGGQVTLANKTTYGGADGYVKDSYSNKCVFCTAIVKTGEVSRIELTNGASGALDVKLFDKAGNEYLPADVKTRDLRLSATDANGAVIDVADAFSAVDSGNGKTTTADGATLDSACQMVGIKVTLTDQKTGVSTTITSTTKE